MTKPRFEKLIRYRVFRNWWAIYLKKRVNNLYDFNTGGPMAIEKRIHMEKPKVDDLFRFILAMGITHFGVEWDMETNDFKCELFHGPLLIVSHGNTVAVAVSQAVLKFLESKKK